MRSEALEPVGRRGTDARREPVKDADIAGADAFEAALLRRGRQGPADDEPAPDTGAQLPLPQALPLQAAPALPPPAEATPRAGVLPAAQPEALARQLRAQALPEPVAASHRWQLQISEAGLPLQRLELQRAGAGPLTVLVGASPEAQQPRHAARLRERLQARGAARVEFRGPAAPEEDPGS